MIFPHTVYVITVMASPVCDTRGVVIYIIYIISIHARAKCVQTSPRVAILTCMYRACILRVYIYI